MFLGPFSCAFVCLSFCSFGAPLLRALPAMRFVFFVFSFFALARDAYIAVMRLVESVDDTITCQKTILAELLKPVEVGRHKSNQTSSHKSASRPSARPRPAACSASKKTHSLANHTHTRIPIHPFSNALREETPPPALSRNIDFHRCLSSAGEKTKSPQVAPQKTAAGGVIKPGKGTTADEWVPRGNTTPKESGNRAEGGPAASGGEDAGGGGVGVSGMDVDEEEGGGEEGSGGEEAEGEKDEEEAEEEEEEEPQLALVSVMTHRNGCKLLLRLLAPDHTG